MHGVNRIIEELILYNIEKQLPRGVLEICGKFTEEQGNFIEIALRHGCSPVNLLHIFRTPFPKNTFEWLLLMNHGHNIAEDWQPLLYFLFSYLIIY